ncbi:MAG: hypothetical protein M1830_006605, partial [Pleopsidium flavum]
MYPMMSHSSPEHRIAPQRAPKLEHKPFSKSKLCILTDLRAAELEASQECVWPSDTNRSAEESVIRAKILNA